MPWREESDPELFHERVAPLLAADPVGHTITLGTLAALRRGDPVGAGRTRCWWHDGGTGLATGVVTLTPPHPVLVAVLPPAGAVALLAALQDAGALRPAALAGGQPGRLNAERAAAAHLAAAWRAAGGTVDVSRRTRLWVLGALTDPPYPVPGTARPAGGADLPVVRALLTAFAAEALGADAPAPTPAEVTARVADGSVLLWEDAGSVVALAGVRVADGQARLGPVYTLPAGRGRGYAAGVTAAATRAGLAAGATAVCLFTDIAAAVPNRLYPRLGYRPRAERCELALGGPPPSRARG